MQVRENTENMKEYKEKTKELELLKEENRKQQFKHEEDIEETNNLRKRYSEVLNSLSDIVADSEKNKKYNLLKYLCIEKEKFMF